jgi:hypothetical protein
MPAHPQHRAMSLFRRSSRRRTETCPPGSASFGTFESRWQYWTRWLRPNAEGSAQQARQAFEAVLRELPGDEAQKLRERVARCGSLRDLWHLRSAVFGLLARQGSEAQAQQRMAALDRYFTTRRLTSAPRTTRRA